MAVGELRETYESPQGSVRWDVRGEGEAVVLLHGTPFSSYIWRDIAPALSLRRRVHVFDMPGYGRSAMHEGQDVSLEAQARVFAALLRHWGLERPHVIAHDIGAAVALRTHLLHGVPCASLALVDPVAIAPWGSPFFRLVGAHTAVFEQLPAHLHEGLVSAYIASAAAEPHPRLLEELVRPWLGDRGQAAFYRQIAQVGPRHTEDMEHLYPDLDLPLTLVWGEEDTWVPPQRGAELAARVPAARLHTVPGAAHLIQEDAPARLLALLADHLDQAATRGR